MPSTRTRPPAAGLLIPAAMAAAICLVVGVESGLNRLGTGLTASEAIRVPHGAVLVGGFAGTLITLERARASGRPFAYLLPLISAGGAALILSGWVDAGRLLTVAAALGLALLMAWFWRLQPQLPMVLVGLGALAWAGATLVWLARGSVVEAVPWWSAFLVLTILGERLELARFTHRSMRPPLAAVAVLAAGLVLGLADLQIGTRMTGAALMVIGGWLLYGDTARVTVGRGGTASYAGAALLGAYTWLALAGALLLLHGLGGRWYDATLHALFVGFVMGAIFAHGPIILPALSGLAVRLNLLMVAALVLLNVSVAARIWAAVEGSADLRTLAGVLHAVAFLLYAGGVIVGVVLASRRFASTREAWLGTAR